MDKGVMTDETPIYGLPYSDIKTTLNYAKTFTGDAYGSLAQAFGFGS